MGATLQPAERANSVLVWWMPDLHDGRGKQPGRPYLSWPIRCRESPLGASASVLCGMGFAQVTIWYRSAPRVSAEGHGKSEKLRTADVGRLLAIAWTAQVPPMRREAVAR